ncbi:hypothetical protein C2869_04275 [Saccharobesus litoralis]|uniref:Polyketide synthase n=1 Tax=Saccharobesus litoralis TaxID=2172099 RepID=A0A2S0VNE8_9ALTE|nr:SDR family NAD(P)-dependent oxidoreductase [Saccharobesus litoralis]AWB65702.1 hypothetical protein C2869_04275 [Saccharobesus litoralis]
MEFSVASIASYIQHIIADKMGVDREEINIKKPFFSIGVSSLVSEEILAELALSFDGLSSTLLFEQPSVTKLAKHLANLTPEFENAPIIEWLTDNEAVNQQSPSEQQSSDILQTKSTQQTEKTEQVASESLANNEVDVANTDSADSTESSESTESFDQQVSSEDAIAVIGISGHFPEASNPRQLWRNLIENRNSVTPVPEKRWDAEALFSDDQTDRQAIFGKWGGFLDGIEYFDPMFFQIPYREAELMDPQQKLFLQCGWELMEDAGYADKELRNTDNIGVYVGVTWNEFSLVVRDANLMEQAYKGPGSLYWGIANRLSYFLDFKGPSVALDTACSSSLVAIHDACQALRNGDCQMAVAGGVNLNLHPAKYQFLSQNHFLSSEGLCRSFGEGGDGYVPGEGVATVLLKPLAQAERDGDFIYGVIRGTSTNHGGKVTGYTVPNPVAHTDLIKTAIDRAGIAANKVNYVECHGTGTELGDPIEITGLTNAFAPDSLAAADQQKQFCAIGSLKSNIGHLEAAAGVAGLIKILLSMQNQTLPASLHAENENPKLKLADSPFYLVKENQKWAASHVDNSVGQADAPAMVAGLSSFGAGGSNAHLIAQNYISEQNFTSKDFGQLPVVLSAQSQAQLAQMVADLADFFNTEVSLLPAETASCYSLINIASSLLAGRQAETERLVILASSIDELQQQLNQLAATETEQWQTINYVLLATAKDNQTDGSAEQQLELVDWAKAWVSGECEKTDLALFSALQQNSRKVPLPTYAFAKERSWLLEGYPLVPLVDLTPNNNLLHPLVDENISTVYQQKFAKTFRTSEFVLRDHLVNETYVIPGVCHLEMARKCASEAVAEMAVEIRDVWFSNVISVPEERRVEIDLTVDEQDLNYQIHDPVTETIFSRGKIAWPDADYQPTAVAQLDVPALQAQMNDEWAISDVYPKFIETGIIQKRSFQVLKRMQFNGDQAIAKLVLPDNLLAEFEQFAFHPALMDGIVQTAMMHVQYTNDYDVKILPFHFSSVKLIAPMQTEVLVYSRIIDQAKKQFDLVLTDLEGKPLVQVDNFILREMKGDGENPAVSDKQQVVALAPEGEAETATDILQHYYYPVWLPSALTKAAEVVGEVSGETEKSLDAQQTLYVSTVSTSITATDTCQLLQIVANESDSQAAQIDAAQTNTVYQVQANQLERYQAVVEQLKTIGKLPQRLIFDFSQLADSDIQFTDVGLNVFLLIKSLITQCKSLQISVLAAKDNTAALPYIQALAGLFKTLKVEKPNFKGRVFTVEQSLLENVTADFNSLNQFITTDWQTQSQGFEVLYQGTKLEDANNKGIQRFSRSFSQLAKAEIREDITALRHQGHYLITGGMGGIGLVFAKYLLENFNAQVYLTGRSKLDDNKQQKLDQLNQLTEFGQAHYIVCDVNNQTSLSQVISDIGSQLNGIIHSAGTIEDNFILKKTADAFVRVTQPKVVGASLLDQLTADIELDFFCLFSSVTAILGNLGQADYGYANAFQDNFCAQRNQLVEQGERSGRSLAINWPYWKNGGMRLTDKEEAVLTRNFGFTPLENDTGIQALIDGLQANIDQLAVLEGDQAKIQSVLGLTEPDPQENPASNADKGSDNTESAKPAAIKYLSELFAQELKIPAERIDPTSSFERYGFDSIVMIDLINIMEKQFTSLPKTLFFEYQTIDELADYFATNHSEHFSAKTEGSSAADKGTKQPAKTATVQSDFAIENVDQAQQSLRFSAKLAPTKVVKPTQKFAKADRLEQSINDDDIAIIGVSGRYPQASNLDEFWQNLASGKDSVQEVPEHLWDWQQFYQPGKQTAGKSYSKWGGFLSDVDQFDAMYFNISPKEAETMDPQERLFLQTATHAIQDSGYTPQTLSKRANAKQKVAGDNNPVGVFVGVMWGDYQLHGVQSQNASQWTTPRSFYWAIANRLSYFYNFSGPSLAIDTACSSSLTAIHMACESLKRGEVDVAIAGGVNLTLHPNKYNLLSEMQFLSTDGRCRSFGEGGDGYVPGDGVGAVVLKPLAQAKADGDDIYAVIKGSALNHGGKTSGFTVPNPNRQSALIKDAFAKSGVNPRHVSYVEAHGTGTSLGDPVEMIGLNKAFQQDDKQYCAIGSVKANIGHLEAAAGIAALTKVLLQLKHKQIAPSIHSTELNSNIDFSRSPFAVQQELGQWQRPQFVDPDNQQSIEVPRLAAISSFGAGGSNAHIVIEEFVTEQLAETKVVGEQHGVQQQPQAVLLSAHNQQALQQAAAQLAGFIEQNTEINLADLAYTSQVGRENFEFRLAFIANNIAELTTVIATYLDAENTEVATDNILVGQASKAAGIQQIINQGQQMLSDWYQQNAQASLATIWVNGGDVDWSQITRNAKRIHIPGYVFTTKRFWTPLPHESSKNSQVAGELTSLIAQNVSTLEQQTYLSLLNAQQPHYQGHLVNGQAIVAGAALAELAVQAAALAQGHEVTEQVGLHISQIDWLAPINLNADSASVALHTEVVRDPANFALCEVRTAHPDAFSAQEHAFSSQAQKSAIAKSSEQTVYMQARLALAEQQQIAAKTSAQINLNAYQQKGQILASGDVQRVFSQFAIELSGKYTAIETIWSSPNFALAHVRTGGSQHTDQSDCYLNPALLDCALRTCLFIGQQTNGTAGQLQVPRELSNLYSVHALPAEFYVLATQLPTESSTGAPASSAQNQYQNHYQLQLVDEQGQQFAIVERFTTQTISNLGTSLSDSEADPVKKNNAESSAQAGESEQLPAVELYLKQALGKVTKLDVADIDSAVALEKYGIDSVMIMALNEALEAKFGELSKTLFYEYQNISSLAGYFVEQHSEQLTQVIVESPLDTEVEVTNSAQVSKVSEKQANQPSQHALRWDFAQLRLQNNRAQISGSQANGQPQGDIAIVGISGKYPKADNLDEFWQNLLAARDCIEEIPASRWDLNQEYVANTIELGKSSGKWGGFINGIAEFDTNLFNILPEQAKTMDPQERLFLQTVWQTLEDAGYAPSYFGQAERERKVGVFAGSMWNQYSQLGLENTAKGQPSMSYSWDASIANRVSYFFDLHGPSVSIDTACSSSLLAIHQACESIKKGECKAAIAGGVNLSLHPYKYQTLTQMQMLASDGRCRSFGEGGDGYVPGEGVGAVLLKPLADAERDGDQIYAVIKGGATNHNGKTNGFTVPNPNAQSEGLQTALQNAGVSLQDLSYIEAHGTGTALGDPIEFNALNRLLKADDQAQQSVALGSVKSNIGHLEGAAGIVALTKVALQLKHQTLVPSLHSDKLNPALDFNSSQLYIPQQITAWQAESGQKRCAAIASLGAGGSNTYLVVEEYSNIERSESEKQHQTGGDEALNEQLIVLSAQSFTSLQGQISKLENWLATANDIRLADVAYTLQVGRAALSHRLAFSVTNIADLRAALSSCHQQLTRLNADSAILKTHVWSANTTQIQYSYVANARDKGWSFSHIDAAAITNRQQLISAWLNGEAIDWQQFAALLNHTASKNLPARRIALPTYSFELQEYWLEATEADFASKRLAPLVASNVSNFNWQAYQSEFSDRTPLIADHKVGEQTIIAGTVLLETALQAAKLAQTSSTLKCSSGQSISNAQSSEETGQGLGEFNQARHIRWYKPFIAAPRKSVTTVLFADEPQSLSFEMIGSDELETLQQADDFNSKVSRTVAVQGQFTQVELAAKPLLDLVTMQQTWLPATNNVAEINQSFVEFGLNLSGGYQAIRSVLIPQKQVAADKNINRSQQALIKLELVPEHIKEQQEFTLAPAVLDGALRSVLMALVFQTPVDGAKWQQLLLPRSLTSLTWYRQIPTTAFAHVKLAEVDYQLQADVHADIDLYDQHGRLVAELTGFYAVAGNVQARRTENIAKDLELSKQESRAVAQVTLSAAQAVTTVSAAAEQALKQLLTDAFSQATGFAAAQVQFAQTFDALGIDSITITKLNRILDQHFEPLSKTLFFECNSLAQVQSYLVDKHSAQVAALVGGAQSAAADNAVPARVATEQAALSASDPKQTDLGYTYINYKSQAIELSSQELTQDDWIVCFGLAQPQLLQLQQTSKARLLNLVQSEAGELQIDWQAELVTAEFDISKPNLVSELLAQLAQQHPTSLQVNVFQTERVDYTVSTASSATKPSDISQGVAKQVQQQADELLKLIRSFAQGLRQADLTLAVQLRVWSYGFANNQQPHMDAVIGLANALPAVSQQLEIELIRLHPGLITHTSGSQSDTKSYNSTEKWQRIVSQHFAAQTSSTALYANQVFAGQANIFEYGLDEQARLYKLADVSQQLVKSAALPLANQSSYLITGGLGAIGLVMASYLANQAQAQQRHITIYLAGRSAQTSQAFNQRLADKPELNSSWVKCQYIQLDISQLENVEQAIADINENAELKGILHCAGQSASVNLLDASDQEFAAPITAKLAGTLNLDQASQQCELDFYLLFSSVTAQMGDFGAGSYAYGNRFLDSFAATRNLQTIKGQRAGRCLSIGWPLWQLDGVQQDDEVVRQALNEFGLQAITAEQGITIVEHCWAQAQTNILSHVSLLFGDAKTVRDKFGLAIQPVEQIASASLTTELVIASDASHSDVGQSHQLPINSRIANALSQAQHRIQIDDDIAIIGLSGHYPQADSLQAFWQNLAQGRDCITEVPNNRWNANDNFSTDRNEKGKVYAKWGSFIDGVDQFDAQLFNISPREAELMDPQERLFLQTSQHCLDDAGYSREFLSQHAVGVYVGVMWGQYQLFDIDAEQEKYGRPGSSFAAIANRVSYSFDFHGPSLSLDTMCSSSLTALHHARQSILAGECDYALAGGVNLSLHPNKYQQLAQGQFLSTDGRCRTFGQGGDGYVPGEGVGVVLLKRLSKAIADNDHIYGVIKATAVNHGGRTNGFTVPNPLAQGDVIKSALKQAAWPAESLSYIEAHGTGTSLGDPIEINGLARAFNTEQRGYCAIGSVKSNIGHLESAAGIAGITKVLLQMQHQTLVPSLHSDTLNENIDFAQTPFNVNRQLQPWHRPVVATDAAQRNQTHYPMRAGVSSFGAGGSNGHVLIEEFQAADRIDFAGVNSTQQTVIPVSAMSAERLQAQVAALTDFLTQTEIDSPELHLADIAFTLQVGRSHAAHRLAVVASSVEQLVISLNNWLETGSDSYVIAGVVDGQSSQLELSLDSQQKVELVHSFINKQNLLGLASAWATSINLDWNQVVDVLYPQRQPGRVSLPVTVLQTQRFWIKQKSTSTAVVNEGLHPLIDQNLSSLFSQQYKKTLTGSEFYLRDHLIGMDQAKMILPGVAYIEMARAAAQNAFAKQAYVTGIRNLMWMSPIVVDGQSQAVFANIQQQNHELKFEIVSELNGSQAVNASGEIIYASELQNSGEILDIEAIRVQASGRYDGNTLYNYYRSIGYQYGPAFQVTAEVYTQDNWALSHLVLPEFLLAGSQSYLLHPSLMDAALRTCLAIDGLQQLSSPIVPFSLEELHYYAPVNQSCYAYATLESSQEQSGASLKRYDIKICDAKGNICVQIFGFAARQLPDYSNKNHYFSSLWQSTDSATSMEKNNQPIDEPCLLIAYPGQKLTELKLAENMIIATQSSNYQQLANNSYELDFTDSQQVKLLFSDLAEHDLQPATVINGLNLVTDEANLICYQAKADKPALQELETTLDFSIYTTLYLFQASEAVNAGAKVQYLYLHQQQHDICLPHNQAISGFAKSLLGLNHRFSVISVGLPSNNADLSIEQVGQLLRNELNNDDAYSGIEIRYQVSKDSSLLTTQQLEQQEQTAQLNDSASLTRSVKRYQALNEDQLSQQSLPAAFTFAGTYIITGGMGKLGQIFARYLITQLQANVILTGRSTANVRTEQLLNELNQLGGKVIYLTCDTASLASVQQLLSQAKAEFGEVKAVLHSAGVVDEVNALELDREGFAQTLQAKVHGGVNLVRAMQAEAVDHLVLFSSISSLLGDLGSGSYAYANKFLNGLAEFYQHQSLQPINSQQELAAELTVTSINWPLWHEGESAEGGMTIPEDEKAVYDFSGMVPLNEQDGIRAFETCLRAAQSNLFVACGNGEKIARTLKVVTVEQVNSVQANSSQASPEPVSTKPASSKPVSTEPQVVAKHATTSAQPQTDNAALHFLLESLASVIKMPASQIDKTARFESYGLDSVMLMEFNKVLSDTLGELPKTVLFEYDSIDSLLAYLANKHADALAQFSGNSPEQAASEKSLQSANEISANIAHDPLSKPQQDKSTTNQFDDKRAELKVANSAKMNLGFATGRGQQDNRVAVVGISGMFPEAENLQQFWQKVVTGENCLREIPANRWDKDAFFTQGLPAGQGLSCSQWGGFIERANFFDPSLFKISEAEAQRLDPQLRLMLKVAWQALEDGGYSPEALAHVPFGVYVGVMNDDYTWLAAEAYRQTGQYQGPGAFASEIANRISYAFDVKGPSLTVEAACASSSSAIHLARTAIVNGECEMALAGGVNLSLHQGKYLMLNQMKVLAPSGEEKTFDAAANGLVPSEGVGAVILKRYDQAVKDGDFIYGVISGSAIGHSGVGPAQNLPSVQALEHNITKALDSAGVNARDISYIESHGTGTELGDPIELKALSNAFKRHTQDTSYCAIGSKANLGHLEAASGICSLIKVLLSFKHNTLAPCANLNEINPSFDASQSPFYFPKEAKKWRAPTAIHSSENQRLSATSREQKGKRIAGINSFGLGGSNAFLVVESHQAKPRQIVDVNRLKPQIFVLSAPSQEQLQRMACNLAEFLKQQDQATRENMDFCQSVAFTLQTGRRAYTERLAIVADGIDELINKLELFASKTTNIVACYSGNTTAGKEILHLLSGSDGEAFIESTMLAKDHSKLADLWVKGCNIPWQMLHGRGVHRTPLPTYPFAEKEYSLKTLLSVAGEPQAAEHLAVKDVEVTKAAARQQQVAVEKHPIATEHQENKRSWFKIAQQLNSKLERYNQSAQPAQKLKAEKVLPKSAHKFGDFEAVYLATASQQASFAPDITSRVQQWSINLPHAMDVELLEKTWTQLANQLTVLRTVWPKNRNKIYQAIISRADAFDCSDMWRAVKASIGLDAAMEQSQLSLINSGIAYQLTWLCDDDCSQQAVLSFDNAVFSANDSLRLMKLFAALCQQDIELKDLSLADYSQIAVMPSNDEAQQQVNREFWQQQALTFEEQLPDLANLDSQVVAAELWSSAPKLQVKLPSQLAEKLRLLGWHYHIDLQTMVSAAWSLVLARHAKAKAVAINVNQAATALSDINHTLCSQQAGSEALLTVEPFAASLNNWPQVIKTSVRQKVVEWLVDIQHCAAQLQNHAQVPSEVLQQTRLQQLPIDSSVTVFDLTTQHAQPHSWQFNPKAINGSSTQALQLIVERDLASIELNLVFDDSQFSAQQVDTWLQYLEVTLQAFVANPLRNPAAISLMTREEYRQKFWQNLEKAD